MPVTLLVSRVFPFCQEAAIISVSGNVNINLCRFYFLIRILSFCDFWFPHGVLFFLYRSSPVVTTSLTPECPSVLSQFLFWLLTTSPTSEPHTTTAELLIWLLASLLLSRHYIILNDHESTFAFDTNCYDVVTWWCIYKRHLSLILEDFTTLKNKLINTNWNKLCRNSIEIQ